MKNYLSSHPKKLFFAALFLSSALLFPFLGKADVPLTFNIQGKLTDKQGKAVTSAKSVTFRIYNTNSGGTALWTESKTITPDSQGRYSHILGSASALSSSVFTGNQNLWLGVQVQGEVEFSPRSRIVSVPYAIISSNAVGHINPKSVSIAGVGKVIDEQGKWVGSSGTSGASGSLILGNAFTKKHTAAINPSTSWTPEETVLTATIPSNKLGSKHGFRIKFGVSVLPGSYTAYFRFKFGGQTLYTLSRNAASSNSWAGFGEVHVFNNQSTSSQNFGYHIYLSRDDYNNVGRQQETGSGTKNVDTTKEHKVEITIQKFGNSSLYPTLSYATVEFLQSQ